MMSPWESLSFPGTSWKLEGWQQSKMDTVWFSITWVNHLTVVYLIVMRNAAVLSEPHGEDDGEGVLLDGGGGGVARHRDVLHQQNSELSLRKTT